MRDAEPMRVLITLHQGGGSGAVNSTLHLALGLARRGVDVRLLCPPDSWVEGEARRRGLTVHPVVLVSRRRWQNAGRIREVLRAHPVDLVNAQSSRDREALTLLALLGRLEQPLVFTRRSWPRTTRLESWLASRAADRVIALSPPVRAALIAQGIEAAKIVVVPAGLITDRIDVAVSAAEVEEWRRRIGWDPGRRTVGVVARPKDQAVVLAALQQVTTPVRLVLSGLTPEALAASLPPIPARHAVVRLPFDPAIRPLYELLEVALHPSRWDALPQAVLEAMALGKPVIASRATGNEVIIRHGLDGLLADPEDPADWARQLDAVLGDAPFAGRLGREARRRAREDFALDRAVEGTLGVYREVLGTNPVPRSALPGEEPETIGFLSSAGPAPAHPEPGTRSSELLLAYDFPPRAGGIAEALGAIARHGHGRLAVSTGRMAQDDAWDRGSGLVVHRAPVAADRLRTIGGLVRWARAADRVLHRRPVTFLWAGNLKPAGHVARWLGARRGIPYGLIVYGLDLGLLRGQARRSARKRRRARGLFRDAAVIVACSAWTAARCGELLEELGLAAAK
ncbi:MAG TPA: glycosyltransferase family 4 protein, partial [Gemmatimonadales bacterium]|nr:glycosyltransferase family 4 protein [Gemmatimonadales bacterium]